MKAKASFMLPIRKSQSGLSLIELMISMAIGLVIMVALLAAYMGTTGSSRVSNALGRMNEDAHGAMSILTQQLRMAGTNPLQPNRAVSQIKNDLPDKMFLFACDKGFSAFTGTAITSSLSCITTGTSAAPDAISIGYEADIYNTASNGGTPKDCLNQDLPSTSMVVGAGTASFYQAVNRYFIRNTASGIPSLYCSGNGAADNPQALVENVEDMQLTFGISQPTAGTGTIAGYLTPTEINTDANLAALATTQSKWARVVSARICILMRSGEPVLDELTPYYKCDGTLEATPTDKRLRRAYTSTVLMRNLAVAN
jgi:type IV pilus assembly protein PilW